MSFRAHARLCSHVLVSLAVAGCQPAALMPQVGGGAATPAGITPGAAAPATGPATSPATTPGTDPTPIPAILNAKPRTVEIAFPIEALGNLQKELNTEGGLARLGGELTPDSFDRLQIEIDGQRIDPRLVDFTKAVIADGVVRTTMTVYPFRGDEVAAMKQAVATAQAEADARDKEFNDIRRSLAELDVAPNQTAPIATQAVAARPVVQPFQSARRHAGFGILALLDDLAARYREVSQAVTDQYWAWNSAVYAKQATETKLATNAGIRNTVYAQYIQLKQEKDDIRAVLDRETENLKNIKAEWSRSYQLYRDGKISLQDLSVIRSNTSAESKRISDLVKGLEVRAASVSARISSYASTLSALANEETALYSALAAGQLQIDRMVQLYNDRVAERTAAGTAWNAERIAEMKQNLDQAMAAWNEAINQANTIPTVLTSQRSDGTLYVTTPRKTVIMMAEVPAPSDQPLSKWQTIPINLQTTAVALIKAEMLRTYVSPPETLNPQLVELVMNRLRAATASSDGQPLSANGSLASAVRGAVAAIVSNTPADQFAASPALNPSGGGGGGGATVPAPSFTSLAPTSGSVSGGTTVVVTGTNLQNVTSVTFGGVAGTNLTVNSATQLTVTTPAGAAGSTAIVLSNAGGTATGAGAYTYLSGAVTTLAGSTQGFTDATGTAAQFNVSTGIAVDAAGNIYVADTNNHKIRKVTSAGVVTTLAGSTQGFTDATGTAAQFNTPYGIAADAAGTVYVADTLNHKIRKITAAGVVTTLAGSTQGFTDATGTAAQFSDPQGIAVDAAGNVYVGDSSNHKIRKITPAGVVTTLAGSTQGFTDATGTAAQFNLPFGVAVDAAGNVYVADKGNEKIRKITPAGVVTTFAGSTQGYTDATGTAAQFNTLYGLTIDGAGNLYAADRGNHKIRKITPAGVVTTLAGSTQGYTDATGTAAQFNDPWGVTVQTNGIVYVADSGNYKIRKIQ